MAPAQLALHDHPPLRPSTVLRGRRTVVVVVAAFVALAAAAAVGNSGLLLTWDEPVRGWVTTHRPDWLRGFFQAATRLGTLASVVLGVTLAALLVRRRCYLFAGMLLGSVAVLPVVEWATKTLVDRGRPGRGELSTATSPSFPSGHTLTAVVIWGLVPPVVALLTSRRGWWWAATVVSGGVIVVVAASRVYLGVHWISDVIGSALLGGLLLLLVERLVELGHRRRPCASCADVPS